jgi:DNA-binding CsgD family transcriptional regulator
LGDADELIDVSERVSCRFVMGGAAAQAGRGRGARRGFSARARRAAFLQAHGRSRKETAAIIGVAPETISVWKRHPQWQVEVERWRELAEPPLDATELRLKFESLAATLAALEQLRLIMDNATRGEVDGSCRQPLRVGDLCDYFSI